MLSFTDMCLNTFQSLYDAQRFCLQLKIPNAGFTFNIGQMQVCNIIMEGNYSRHVMMSSPRADPIYITKLFFLCIAHMITKFIVNHSQQQQNSNKKTCKNINDYQHSKSGDN